MTIARHLTITGRVQGVSYRAWLKETADALGIAGWVRNRKGGSVEAVICGDPHTVNSLITACRTGPPAAAVRDVIAGDSALYTGSGFDIRPTE